MKLYTASLLLILFATPLDAAPVCDGLKRINYTPIEERYKRGLLFKIGKCGKPASYIFGTVHSDDPQIEKATAADAISVLKRSQAAGFEYIVPENAGEITTRYMFLDSKQSVRLPDLIGKENFKLVARELQRRTGLPPTMTQGFKPWAAAVMLQYPESVADKVILDMRLQQVAEEHHIPLFGLETMEGQFKLFDSLTEDLQIKMLKETLEDIDQINAANDELLIAYKQGNLRKISKLSDKSIADIEEPELRNFLVKSLMRDRNQQMVNRLQKELRDGKRFIAVGALHLLGKGGILELMEKKGYLVESLPLAH